MSAAILSPEKATYTLFRSHKESVWVIRYDPDNWIYCYVSAVRASIAWMTYKQSKQLVSEVEQQGSFSRESPSHGEFEALLEKTGELTDKFTFRLQGDNLYVMPIAVSLGKSSKGYAWAGNW